MTPRLSASDHVVLCQILRHTSPTVIFQAIGQFYQVSATIADAQRHHEQAAECAIARDGSASIVSMLSEMAAANDRASAELCDLLQRSLRSA